MSHLSLPRIHFQGEMFANVPTGNNDDVVKFIDVANVTIDTNNKTDAEIRKYLTEVDPAKGKIRASWNYYGSGRCWFDKVTVTSLHTPNGDLDQSDDPLIGATLNLNRAYMVDVDPESIFSSQIFCDTFQIKDSDGLLCTGQPTRFYSHWHYSHRNLAYLGERGFKGVSVVWQAVIPKTELQITAGNSPLLAALHNRAQAGQGLFIRFCTYFFKFDLTHEELAQRFRDSGEITPQNLHLVRNPAHGRILGTIGPWLQGETASLTANRCLFSSKTLVFSTLGFSLGPAAAHIDPDREKIVLDLITTIPEQDNSLKKLDRGPAWLKVYHPLDNGAFEPPRLIGPVPYDQQTYETQGGIVEVNYPKDLEALLDKGQLRLYFGNSNYSVLQEEDFTIDAAESGIYLDQGETHILELRVYKKGKPIQDPIVVKLEQYIMTDFDRDKAKSITPTNPASLEDYIVDVPEEIWVDPGGVFKVPLFAKIAGTCLLRFVVVDPKIKRFHQWYTNSFFTNIRVLPADNEEVSDTEVADWNFIYQKVLRYYHLIYPAMSLKIDLSQEAQVRQYAREIKAAIAKDNWHSWSYMPTTRDLSAGKRKLLERWCDLVIAAETSVIEEPQEEPQELNLPERSNIMSDYVMITAKFNAKAFFTTEDTELEGIREEAKRVFGVDPNDPNDNEPDNPAEHYWKNVSWTFAGTPAGGEGGWLAIIPRDSFVEFSKHLRGVSKFFDLDIQYLNRTDPIFADRTTSTAKSMVPVNSAHW